MTDTTLRNVDAKDGVSSGILVTTTDNAFSVKQVFATMAEAKEGVRDDVAVTPYQLHKILGERLGNNGERDD